ncbi:transposase [Sulfurifustis variabilis]|uniref:Transposase n=1 Tax=Sulfurifustis variabilis TaxID=1675686 RepID=A0A1B4V6V2_9GAMM|nr:IS1595 family transposase [Sulfurifustis variabilis]BAU47024.1 transposase [Sulfurifustis variabilis]
MKTTKPKIAKDKSEIIANLPRACSDETAAVEFLEEQRWGDHPACPHCGSVNVYQMKGRDGERNKRFLWKCRENECGKQFTVRVGTVFEDSLIPLRHWCFAFWQASTSKKGVSAMQIKRQTGLSYKSALFMMHRIRYAMADDYSKPEPMTGTVEVDETYVGGKPRHKGPHNIKKRGRGTDKAPVVALVERNGNVRAMTVPTVNAKNLRAIIHSNVHKSARIMTDDAPFYKGLNKHFEGGHSSINHSQGVYAKGDVTTNTVEGFFSILKRGINGVYHSVSKQHLHRYLSEFEYRYNTRKMEDGERTVLAIRKADGKRLRYREPRQTP